MSKSDRQPPTRNSVPPLLARIQAWMESERLLRKALPVEPASPIRVLRVRRNFKFRKITVQAGGKRYICYSHHWPRGLRNLAWFSAQALAAGVNVPQPLSVRTRWYDLATNRAFTLVLPYIEGEHLGSQSYETNLTALGRSLGRLHGITAPAWGPLMTNFPKRGHYWVYLRKYWRQTGHQLQQYAGFATDRDIDRVITWLLERGQFLKNLRHFNLIHGDPASGNFLVQQDGELCLIDCDRIAFEPGPLELANALLQDYCDDDAQRRQVLIEAYLQNCPDKSRTLWEEHAQFFIAAALLWRTQRKLQWAMKRPDTGGSMSRAELAWRQLPLVIQARPASWQAALALLGD